MGESHLDFMKAMESFKLVAVDWNVHTFVNIFWPKRHILLRLESIQRSMMYRGSNFLEHLEQELIDEYSAVWK